MNPASVDTRLLGEMARLHRKQQGLNLRDAAERIGISFNALSRLERGKSISLQSFVRVVVWLEENPGCFFVTGPTDTI